MNKLTKETYYQDSRISNSSLSWILPESGGSPAKYEQFSLFPPEDEEKEAMRMGSLLHRYLEMGDKLDMDVFVQTILPSPGIHKIAEEVVNNLPHLKSRPQPEIDAEVLRVARYNEYQNNWKDATIIKKVLEDAGVFMLQLDEAKTTGKILLSPEEYTLLETAGRQLEKKLPWVFNSTLLPPGVNTGDKYEVLHEYIIEFEIDDTPCKAMIDLLVVNHTTKKFQIYDLKSTSTPLSFYLGYEMDDVVEGKMVQKWIPGTYLKWNVHRQMAMYNTAVMSQFPDYSRRQNPIIIACETKLPFDVQVCEIPYETMQIGNMRVLWGIHLLKENEFVGVGL